MGSSHWQRDRASRGQSDVSLISDRDRLVTGQLGVSFSALTSNKGNNPMSEHCAQFGVPS